MKKSWLTKIGFLTLICALPCISLAASLDAGRKLIPISEQELVSLSSKYRDELEKAYPLKSWKTIGFCDWNKKLLMTMKVPVQMEWEKDCPNGGVVKGIQCCGPSESGPRLIGKFKVDSDEKILQVGMEAFETATMEKRYKKKVMLAKEDLESMNSVYRNANVLLKEIQLGGLAAPLVKIDDVNRKVPNPEITTLIRFQHNDVGGMLYFVENDAKSFDSIPHQQHKLDSIVSSVIDSFKFTMPVTKLK